MLPEVKINQGRILEPAKMPVETANNSTPSQYQNDVIEPRAKLSKKANTINPARTVQTRCTGCISYPSSPDRYQGKVLSAIPRNPPRSSEKGRTHEKEPREESVSQATKKVVIRKVATTPPANP